MNKPRPFAPRRAFRPSRSEPRTGPAAAIALVRVEFERARHLRELERLQVRADAARRELRELDERAAALLGDLGTERVTS